MYLCGCICKNTNKIKLLGRLAVAQSVAEQALKLDPKSIRARIRLLRALLRAGDFAACTKIGAEVLSQDPTNNAARADLSAANLNIRRLEGMCCLLLFVRSIVFVIACPRCHLTTSCPRSRPSRFGQEAMGRSQRVDNNGVQ